MDDITVQMIRNTVGKNMFVREAMINGVLTGLAVQGKLILAGETFYDGAFVAVLKELADKRVSEIIKVFSHDCGRLLSDELFVGWDDKKSAEREYFTYFGTGMMYVCNLYRELASTNLDHRTILAKSYDIIEKRSAELKELI
ncbi:hypothetical protein A2572_04930 [Candidatus Collierbacteria bacterium RIFOXYD1_FULL_40_9]|uniref:Uncharacterized protein n=1 Tax=Candidatus Collierbacteria bacterium RIFOXYD1_FULL_40_9 TaxID=1817731 RepID=A0A1F5FV70_9BACT|nr:MAG: hypothetical protein A2572_04930 [Candidatus Collierbacteria bacterium RIFOXYD1_FULL_40_9]